MKRDVSHSITPVDMVNLELVKFVPGITGASMQSLKAACLDLPAILYLETTGSQGMSAHEVLSQSRVHREVQLLV